MNIPIEFNKDEQACEVVPNLRKLNQWYISVTETDLELKLRDAFEAAKKSGRDLDVTFTGEPL